MGSANYVATMFAPAGKNSQHSRDARNLSIPRTKRKPISRLHPIAKKRFAWVGPDEARVM
jgi:hypothetical protein